MPSRNADGTLLSVLFRANPDGDAQHAAQRQDIIEVTVNFGGNTFWRAFETHGQVGAKQPSLSCMRGTEAANGISFRVSRDDTLPELATAWLALPAPVALFAARACRRK